MAGQVFPILTNESVVRTEDKTRLDASKSFKTSDADAIIGISIKPEASESFYPVADYTKQNLRYLDWVYSTAGTKTITLRITTTGPVNLDKTFSIIIKDEVDDKVLTTDADLLSEEPDVLKYVKEGRASHIDLHRTITERVLTEIYKERILATDGSKLTIDEILDYSEVKEWALYWVLETLFSYVSNVPGDIFETTSKEYEQKKLKYKNLAMNILKLDYNKNGTLDVNEGLDYRSTVLVRR